MNKLVFNLLYRSFQSLVRKRRCKLGCSTVLTPRCVVTLVVHFAVVNPISHFPANASGEALFHLVDEIKLIFTYSSIDAFTSSLLEQVNISYISSSRQNGVSPEALAEKWDIWLKTEKRTTKVITQRGVRTAEHPSF